MQSPFSDAQLAGLERLRNAEYRRQCEREAMAARAYLALLVRRARARYWPDEQVPLTEAIDTDAWRAGYLAVRAVTALRQGCAGYDIGCDTGPESPANLSDMGDFEPF